MRRPAVEGHGHGGGSPGSADRRSSHGARIVGSTIWSAAESWGREATTFVIFVLLARLLGPSAIGLLALAMAAPLVLSIPVTQGIPDALVQREEIEPIHLDSAFWLLLAAGATTTGIVWLAAPLVALAFGEPLLEDLVRWTSLVIVIRSVASVPIAVLKRDLQFRLFAMRTMLGAVGGGVTGLGLALAGFGVWSLVWMTLGRAMLETAFILLSSAWRPRLRFSFARCRELFGFGGPIIAQSLVQMLNDEIPKVAIGTFLSPAAVGIYALARKPVDLLAALLIRPVNAVTMPAVARLQGEPAKIDRFFDIGVRLSTLIAYPAFVGLAAIAPALLPAALGADWAEAVMVTQILLLLGLQRPVDSFCAHIILALGHSRLLLTFHVAYTLIGALSFPLAAQLSLEAVAVATVLANVALLPLFLYQARKLAGIDVLKPLRMLPLLAAVVTVLYLGVGQWQDATAHLSPGAAVTSSVLVGVLVYAVGVALLLRDDAMLLLGVVSRLRPVAGKT